MNFLLIILVLSGFADEEREDISMLNAIPQGYYKYVSFIDVGEIKSSIPQSIAESRYGIGAKKGTVQSELPASLENRWQKRLYATKVEVKFIKLKDQRNYSDAPKWSMGLWHTKQGSFVSMPYTSNLIIYKFNDLDLLFEKAQRKLELLPSILPSGKSRIFSFVLKGFEKPFFCSRIDGNYLLVADKRADLIKMLGSYYGEASSFSESELGATIRDMKDEFGFTWFLWDETYLFVTLKEWLQKFEPESDYIDMADEEMFNGHNGLHTDLLDEQKTLIEKEFYFCASTEKAKKKKEMFENRSLTISSSSNTYGKEKLEKLHNIEKSNTTYKVEGSILIKKVILENYFLEEKDSLLQERIENWKETQKKN